MYSIVRFAAAFTHPALPNVAGLWVFPKYRSRYRGSYRHNFAVREMYSMRAEEDLIVLAP